MWRRRNEGVNHLASVKEILRRERPPQRVRQPFSAGGLGPSRTSLEGPQDDLARFRKWNRPVKLKRDVGGPERQVFKDLFVCDVPGNEVAGAAFCECVYLSKSARL